ncbi:hypothetical protein OBBRIDRAFT_806119 [Obba rivulosa]|uniref:Uncharacterized protein n=1 Tax=Obba rivulosa TaxID=1052685 RepID=A0A8E2AMD4_9APHY|nr:hypothetical protein OBBRIDRAFT_806119 [Obba rivulosa]
MHTLETPGVNVDLVKKLEINFTWKPPLGVSTQLEEDHLEGPELITMEELENAFNSLAHNIATKLKGVVDGGKVLEGEVYDFDELARVDRGLVPAAFEEEITVVDYGADVNGAWNIHTLMMMAGITTQ